MKVQLRDKGRISAWILLSVYIPMVLFSLLHIHPDITSDTPCHECMEHTVHNGHIAAIKATVDCPLCAFQASVYQGEEDTTPLFNQHFIGLVDKEVTPAAIAGVVMFKPGRAPPYSFCA